jgi:hypothetical protein
MKRLLQAIAISTLLTLTACGGFQQVLDIGSTITQPFKNPFNLKTQYEVEAAVAGVRRAGLAVMQTRQCRKSESASITNICVHRVDKLKVQQYSAKLDIAVNNWRKVATSGDTLTAVDALNAVYAAIKDYQTTIDIAKAGG